VPREYLIRPAAQREGADAIGDLLLGLLRRTHLSTPSSVAAAVCEEAARIGATEIGLYLIDYEQSVLVPVPGSAAAGPPLSVAGTMAGRAFSSTTILRTAAQQLGRERVWLPLLDGTERLGVISLSLPDDVISEPLVAACERFAHLVAILIVSKAAYGDTFERVRRCRPMTIASELVWALAPPLVFATDDLTIAGMLEPAYDNGGDALDYAVDDRVLHLGIFDAMGHGLAAAGVAAFAVSAYRHSRRGGRDLLETHAAMDDAVGQQFPDRRFVTALIAQLELDSGRLQWLSAGHPTPLVIRNGRNARSLQTRPAPPLGVNLKGAPATVAEESLEPGDMLLLYTDGLTEAHSTDGHRFSLEHISQFIEREVAAEQTAPETLRRIRHAIIGRERASLRDDATALLVEWRSGNEYKLLPPSTP
jgi:serine/threonine protein phosphatase PrpC